MAQEIQYSGNTGMVTITTSEPAIDGTGSPTVVLTAGASGTLIKSIIIKAQGNTTQGMIRFFINDASGDPKIIKEVNVPKVTQSGTSASFCHIIDFNFSLLASDNLYVTTQNSETFNIIAIGLDWSYGMTARSDKTEYYANTGIQQIKTPNSNLSDAGTIDPVLIAGTGGATNGCWVKSILVKAQQDVNLGMVRLWLQDGLGGTKYCFFEIPVAEFTYSPTTQSYEYTLLCGGWLWIKDDYKILASTENGEKFSVIAEGFDWKYTA